jgi:3-hydroxyisobutyrate dehydrogenase
MATIAVLGRGTMGEPMARNLERAGLDVRTWSPSSGGAAADAVRGADFVLTIVPDGDAVEETMFGDGGAATAMAEGAIWIQSSTVGVAAAERLGALAAEHGIAYVDAPVLGTKEPAEKGELVVLASGPEELRERCTVVFETIGRRTVWLGGAGAGSRMKLVTNNWLLALVEGAAETIALAEALGLDPSGFLEIVAGGALDSPYLQLKGQTIVQRRFEPSFRLELARKDAGLVLEAADAAGLQLLLTEAATAQFDRAIELGHGGEDMAAVYYAVAGAS